MRKEITFILPTMNRRQFICRAVDSCLACSSELVTPHVLVIDGMSDDGSYELLLETYGNNSQVTTVRHDRVGFQRTAYFGALQVTTEYAAFMYDDDVISPYFHQMFGEMIARNKDFAMGYGHSYNVSQVYPFKPIQHIELYSKYDVTLAYFGYYQQIRYFGLPVSPICCIVTAEHLKNWVRFSQEYAKGVAIRQYYMIDQNIGPDIILYLSSILKEAETALLANSIVGQFSEHTDSMSIGYGVLHLQIGYWLGRLWALEEVCRQGNKTAAARCAAYLLVWGMYLLVRMPFSKDRSWFWGFSGEMAKVLLIVARNALFLPFIRGLFSSIRNKFASKQMTGLPD